MMQSPTIHASAVLLGTRAVLIRGAAGSGKSELALTLIQSSMFPFARLIGDDRVSVEAAHGRLLVRPHQAIAGLLELRGLGIRRLPYEPVAAVGLVVDLGAAHAERLPAREATVTELAGIVLPRLAVAPGQDVVLLVIAALRTEDSGQ
jgi:HPr kinase/phosphorylase